MAVRTAAALMCIAIGFAHCATAAQVTAIGCASDGQNGPVRAPAAALKIPVLPTAAAMELAYYFTFDGIGVLAPLGWHCFGLYGSNGSQIIVTPEPHGSRDLLARPATGLTGPAVQLIHMYGGTSGRFAVARVIARLFPAYSWFVRQVVAEGIRPGSEFAIRPYPKDTLKRLGPNEVRFWTLGSTDGIGTESRLARNEYPIAGVALLYPTHEMDLIEAFVRLPPEMAHLTPAIIKSLEGSAH